MLLLHTRTFKFSCTQTHNGGISVQWDEILLSAPVKWPQPQFECVSVWLYLPAHLGLGTDFNCRLTLKSWFLNVFLSPVIMSLSLASAPGSLYISKCQLLFQSNSEILSLLFFPPVCLIADIETFTLPMGLRRNNLFTHSDSRCLQARLCWQCPSVSVIRFLSVNQFERNKKTIFDFFSLVKKKKYLTELHVMGLCDIINGWKALRVWYNWESKVTKAY